MIDTDDKLLGVFDQLVEAVYWSAESGTFAEALFEAIDDWVALVAAEFNESVAIEADSTGGGLGGVPPRDGRGGRHAPSWRPT